MDSNGHMLSYMNIEIREELRECIIEATLKFDIQKMRKQ